MEEQRKECNSKKVMLPRVGGGGGPETLILWGGALAVAGLVAAFSFKKRRNSSIVKEEEEEKEKSDGLRFFLHHQSSSPALSLNPRSVSSEIPSKIGVTQIDDCANMEIMEEKDTSSGEYQEILQPSDSEKESIFISTDGDGDEEFPVLILENMAVDELEKVIIVASMEPSNMEIEFETVTAEGLIIEQDLTEKTSFSSASIMDDNEETSEQSPSSTEAVEEIEEEISMESQLIGVKEENHYRTESSLSSSESDEYSPNQPASTEEEEEEEEVTGNEESSEEGGRSTEAIWPAEIIEYASTSEHRKSIINYDQKSGESFEQRDRNTTSKEAEELVMVAHEGKHDLIKWQIALFSVVLPLLLLLLNHCIITPKYSF